MAERFILAPARPDLAGPVPRRTFISRMLGLAAGGALFGRAGTAHATPGAVESTEPFLGEIAMVAFNFAPKNWAFCNGFILPIASNTALFQLLGTTYGGNGSTTFALPDLRGRVPIHFGQGAGLSARVMGERSGQENVTLTVAQMPSHTHTAHADAGTGVSDQPNGRYLARNAASIPMFGNTPGASLGAAALDNTGGSQPHSNMQPFLAINFIICIAGIYPSQNATGFDR